MTRTILVVDDEPDIRALVRLALEHLAGWRVLDASGGEEALTVAADERPDAILLDFMMPGMDGSQTARRLGEDPRTATIPVVFLTAKAGATIGRGTPDGGTDGVPGPGVATVVGVLPKPFDAMSLADQVRGLLGWPA